MYSDTITLFNRFGDMWYPTVITGVNLNMDKAAIMAKYGAESKDKAVLNIRYHIAEEGKKVGDKIWLPPKEWSRQDEGLLPKSLTFTSGQEFDFFYAGDWGSEEPVSDNAYGIDGFYDYMNRQYDYVFAITTVGGPYTVIPLFEIMGA